jgi:hypothetical protein
VPRPRLRRVGLDGATPRRPRRTGFAIDWASRVAWPLVALLAMLVARAALVLFVPVSLLSSASR